MKKELQLLLGILLLTTIIASAELAINEPLDVYNLGDRLYVTTTGLQGLNEGNLDINLECHNETVTLVRLSARAFSTEEEQEYSIPYKVLDKNDLGTKNMSNIIGPCQVTATLGTQQTATKTFRITNNINIEATINKQRYNPGETVTLSITAIKENGRALNGFAEISNATTFDKAVEEGIMKEQFQLPETIEAGTYNLDIHTYDQTENGILNEGKKTITFTINQVASFVKLSLEGEEATPGEEYKIGAEVFDQSGKEMGGTVQLGIITPKEEIRTYNVASGDYTKIPFEKNATPGLWKIRGIYDKVGEEREFTMKAIPKVTFTFDEENILHITNIGNAAYNKTVNIMIGEEKKELELRIQPGEERKFKLSANGETEVIVEDGEERISKNVLLTGRAISVEDLDEGLFSLRSLLLILLLIIIILTIYMSIKHWNTIKEKLQHIRKSKNKELLGTTEKKSTTKEDNIKDYTNTATDNTTATNTATIKGNKYPSSVLALHLQNYNEINENSKKELRRIIETNAKPKGLIDERGEYTFILYSPLITKTFHNELQAIKTAKKIHEELQAHNKKFNNKIAYNIGIHNGELVATKNQGSLRYTSIGNTIPYAKKLADNNTTKILISEEVRKKLLRQLQTEKEGMIGEKSYYSVKEIKNEEANNKKLKELLKRMDHD